MPYNKYPYELPPLPYPYDALEPYIDTETMHYHHDKHFKTYIDNLNDALKPYPELQKLTLDQLLTKKLDVPHDVYVKIMRNGGGVYNHAWFFERLSAPRNNNHVPTGVLMDMINNTFGSFDNFKKTFSQNALAVFGSGWTCLALTPNNELKIINLKDQDTILRYGAVPIILIDVWEHAYYLKYKNLRKDYIDNFWNVVKFPELRYTR